MHDRTPGAGGRFPAAGNQVTLYRLRTAAGETDVGLLQFIGSRHIVRTSVYTSLVVGTILTLINQGDIYLANRVTATILIKTLLTYVVPYCVSTFGALSAARVRWADRAATRSADLEGGNPSGG